MGEYAHGPLNADPIRHASWLEKLELQVEQGNVSLKFVEDDVDEVRHTIWEHPVSSNIEYIDLTDVISFEGFNADDFVEEEKRLLTPQLENLGHRVVCWLDAGINYLAGSSGRVCKTKDEDGTELWWIYE